MEKIAVWFGRLWTFVMLRLGVYYAWSKFYQRVHERWVRPLPGIDPYPSLAELEGVLGRIAWRKDGVFEAYDAIGSPKATWYKHVWKDRFDGLKIRPGLDCDEFALFAADRVADMVKRDVGGTHIIRDVGILTIPWRRDKKNAGHNVCAFSYVQADDRFPEGVRLRWAWIGNWYNGKVQWDFDNLTAIVRAVCGTGTSLGWAFADINLKVRQYRWKV